MGESSKPDFETESKKAASQGGKDRNAAKDESVKESSKPDALINTVKDTAKGVLSFSKEALNEAQKQLLAAGLLNNLVLLEQPSQTNQKGKETADKKAGDAQKDVVQKPLSKEEAQRSAYRVDIQKELITELPALVEGNSPKEKETAITAQRKALEAEIKKEVWGSVSQETYKKYQMRVEGNLAAAESVLKSLGKLSLQAGFSLDKPIKDGKTEDPLSEKGYKEFSDNRHLLIQSAQKINDALDKLKDADIEKVIKEKHLPQGWLKRDGLDPNLWRCTVSDMISLSLSTKNAVENMDHLSRAEGSSFPFNPPLGTEFDRNSDGSIARNRKDGSLKGFSLNLPDQVRPESLVDQKKINDLREWLTQNQQKIKDTITDYKLAVNSPETAIAFNNIPVSNKLAYLDKEGHFIGLVPNDLPTDKMTALTQGGEKLVHCNLLCPRAEVKIATEGENKGKPVLSSRVDVYDIPWHSVYNAWGTKVASTKPDEPKLEADKIYYVGDKAVPVLGGNLSSYLSTQALGLRLWQGGEIGVDALLALSTFGEGTALKGAMSAEKAAYKLSAAEIRNEAAKIGVKAGVALAGPFVNNAYTQEHELGRWARAARNLYFLGEMSSGLVRDSKMVNNLLEGSKIPGVVTASDKLANAVKESSWLGAYNKTVSRSGLAFFGPFVAVDLAQTGKEMIWGKERDHLRDAALIFGDGRSYRSPDDDTIKDPIQKDVQKKREQELEKQSLKLYSEALQSSCGDASKAQKIKGIFDRTAELLDSNDTAAREAYKKELLGYFTFDTRAIRAIESAKFAGNLTSLQESEIAALKAHRELPGYHMSQQDWDLLRRCGQIDNISGSRSYLTSEQLAELHNPAKLEGRYNNDIKKVVQDHLSRIGPDLRTAAAVGLLALNRKDDNTLPTKLAEDKVDKRALWFGTNNTQSLTPEELKGFLLQDLAQSDASSRNIVIGELLTRMGACSGTNYANILEDVLKNQNSSREDKMRALSDPVGPRCAAALDGLRGATKVALEQGSPDAIRFMQSARGLETTITNLAQNKNEDPDVRAMAAMILYGANHPDRAQVQKILQDNNEKWQKLADASKGTYAREVQEFFQNEIRSVSSAQITSMDPSKANDYADLARATKLNAVIQSANLTAADDKDAQKQIAQNIASCFSPSNVNISLEVLGQIFPQRANLLTSDVQEALKAKAVDLLASPYVSKSSDSISLEQEKQAAAIVKLTGVLKELLKDDTGKLTKYCQKLEAMIDPLRAVPGIDFFPDLQIEAIHTLASLNSQSAIPIIRARLTGQTDDKLPVSNSNPEVRLEAVAALAKLKDKQFYQLLPDLIKKETDRAVAESLRQKLESNQSFSAVGVAQESQNTRKALKDYEAPPSNEEGKRYLNQKDQKGDLVHEYELLNPETYIETARKAVQALKDPRGWSSIYDYAGVDAVYARWCMDEISKVTKACNEQRAGLVEKAKGANFDTNKEPGLAKAALSAIMNTSTVDLAKFAQANTNSKDYPTLTVEIKSFPHRAARALVDVLKNGEDKPQTAQLIAEGLASKSLPPEIKSILLGGWRYLAEGSGMLSAASTLGEQPTLGFSKKDLATMLTDAIKAENERVNHQSDKEVFTRQQLRTDLIDYSKACGDLPAVRSYLLAIAAKDPSKEMRYLASSTLYEMQDSVDLAWRTNLLDKGSSSENRSQHLKQAIEEWSAHRDAWAAQTNASQAWLEQAQTGAIKQDSPLWDAHKFEQREALVRTIVTNYKNAKLNEPNSSAEKQSLSLLSQLMDDPDAKVRLTAARVIGESSLPANNSVRQKSITVYTALSESNNPQVKKEASALLAAQNTDRSQ